MVLFVSFVKKVLLGVFQQLNHLCLGVSDREAIQLEAKQALQVIDTPIKGSKNVAASSNVLECESVSSSSLLHMQNLCKGQDMSMVDKQLAKYVSLTTNLK